MTGDSGTTRLHVYVLAKNEEANIARCLDAVCRHPVEITVLDSGSTDRTVEIASRYSAVKVIPYAYKSHCLAGNEICAPSFDSCEYAMILDADMAVSAELFSETERLIGDPRWDIVMAPVAMYVDGRLLRRGSLCPPKAFVFKTGRPYFVPSGHGEALQSDCRIAQASRSLVHDDRKGYDSYLLTQLRYARNLKLRAKDGAVTVKDVVRLNTPLLMFIVPFFSYFIKFGFLSGKAGFIYALDRLVAEAIMFRQSLSERV